MYRITAVRKAARNQIIDAPARKRDQRAKVQQFRQDLKPGIWILSASRVARHWRARQPDVLALSAHGSKKATSGSWWIRAARRLPYLWATVVPPWVTRVPRVAHASSGQSLQLRGLQQRHTLLATKPHRPDVILLRPPWEVLRTHHAAPVTDEYVAVRRALHRYFDLPDFEVAAGGAAVIEEFVDGTPVSTLPDQERAEVVRELLRRYVEVAGNPADASSHYLMMLTLGRVRAAPDAPQLFKDAVAEREQRILVRARSWPLVPSHVSSQANNYVLAQARPVPLDFQNVRYAPFFFDALKAVHHRVGRRGAEDAATARALDRGASS